MRFRVAFPIVVALVFAAVAVPRSRGDVVVLANRTRAQVKFTTMPLGTQLGEQQRQVQLASGDVVPVPTEGELKIEFFSGTERIEYPLDANSAYFFASAPDGRLGLQKIGLGGNERTRLGRKLPGSDATTPLATINVKILVDEDEHFVRKRWEDRLRRRVQAASEILQSHARVRLKVVAVETWQSDDRFINFFESLSEFEKEVDPGAAQLVIGFTSQYELSITGRHLGGIYGPLRRHILIREWSTHISERERLEVLVHEVGHYLGAAHSPEDNTVMRPILGDRQARIDQFTIRFDPVNTLAMYMVGEEIRRRSIKTFAEISPETKERLGQIYRALMQANPTDPSVKRFLALTRVRTPQARPTQPAKVSLEQAARQIVAQVVTAARANIRLPASADATRPRGPGERRFGDPLTQHYVRQAARAAAKLPPDVGPSAFVLSLGIALDNSASLSKNLLTRDFVAKVEQPTEREKRLQLIGKPTVHGRQDLARHFIVSAYLTAALGDRAAEAAGLAKEVSDADGGSGFSFADIAANQAGIALAQAVLSGRLPLAKVARSFRVDAYVPSLDGLAEGLDMQQFNELYGGGTNDAYRQTIQEIRRRIEALPPYQTSRRRAAR